MMTQTNLNARQVSEVFGVSHMTIWNWRQGTKTVSPLPCQVKARSKGSKVNSVLFKPASILKWADKNQVYVVKDPQTFGEDPAAKPGPKPRIEAKQVKPVKAPKAGKSAPALRKIKPPAKAT